MNITTQFIKYFGAALIGYVFDIGVLLILKEVFQLHYLISATAGFIIGLIIVYILSSRFVFGSSKIESKYNEFILFAVIGVVGLGLLNLLMWIMTDMTHLHYIVSKLLATIIVYLWNFLARRALYHN